MRLLAASLILLLPMPLLAANCDTELKSTDTYKELSAKLKCLNDRINSLEGSGATAQKKNLTPRPAAGIQVQEVGGKKIELESCLNSGSSVACTVFITTIKDGNLSIGNSSRALDEQGAILEFEGFRGANEENVSRPMYGYVHRYYVSEVRTMGAILFKSAKRVELLSAIQIKTGDNETFTFRNVAVQ